MIFRTTTPKHETAAGGTGGPGGAHLQGRCRAEGLGAARLAWRATWRSPLLGVCVGLMIFFVAVAGGLAATGVGGGPVGVGGPRPATPAILAAEGPQPSRQEIGSGVEIGMYFLGTLIAVMQVVQFFRPQPALHKQFADREATEKQLDKVLIEVTKMTTRFEGYMSEQATRRRVMYSRLNRMENAIACQIGMLSHAGREHDAERLQKILDTRVEASHDE